MKQYLAITFLTAVTAALNPAIVLAQSDSTPVPRPAPEKHVQEIEVKINDRKTEDPSQAGDRVFWNDKMFEAAKARARSSGDRFMTRTAIVPHLTADRADEALVVRTQELDSETQSNLEEDLNVMSRILDKATDGGSARGPRAMGIDLLFRSGGSPVRSLYLEGYGALFMLNVNFPLIAPPAPDPEEAKGTKSDTETTWEQTRQELYGVPNPPDHILGMGSSAGAIGSSTGGIGSGNAAIGWNVENAEEQDYDANKVERLRQTLLEALKNATNIRQLTDDDSVTLCVVGAPALSSGVRIMRNHTATENTNDEQELAVVIDKHLKSDATTGGRAVMTLQARKADIDRFARGEINLDEFRDLTKTQTYPGGAGGSMTPNAFIWTGH